MRLARRLLALPPAYLGTALLLVLAAVMRPQLLSMFLLPLIARQAAPLGLAVIGQSLVMRVRSIDLSSGGVIVAVSYILTSGYFPVSDAAAMGLCIVLGLAVGIVNGVLIVKARASSMIVTLAMAMILLGIVIALSQFRAPGDAPEFLRELARLRVLGIPLPVLVWLAVLAPVALLLRTTVYGRYLDAVGDNPLAAALSAYTSGSARVNHLDDTGTIRVGALADLAVLDRNPFDAAPEDLWQTTVVSTFVEGQRVHPAPAL